VDARSAAVIAAKDLRLRLRDRSVFLLGLVAPLVLATVLNVTVGGADAGFQLRLGLVDADGGPVAAGFDALAGQLEADGVAVVSRFADDADARRAVDAGEVSAAVVLPAGLSAAVAAGAPAELVVIGAPEAPVGTQVARSIAEAFAHRLDADRVAAATVAVLDARPPDAATVAEVTAAAAGRPPAVTVADDPLAARGFDFGTFFAIGLSVFFLFFTVQFGVLGVMEEREQGTMGRLLAAPITPSSVLVGKLGASVALGAVSMVVLIVATTVLLGARWGPVGPVAVLVAMGVLSAVALTALIMTLARTSEQAGSYATLVAVVLGVLGGTFFPVGLGSPVLDLLSRATPHRWLVDGFRSASLGEGLGGIADSVIALAVFVVVVGGLGLARSRSLVARR
jgi:ABC-2 type transport system permease protein